MIKARLRLGLNARKQFAQLGRPAKMMFNKVEIKLEYVDVEFKDQAEADKFLSSVECKHFMEIEVPKESIVAKVVKKVKKSKKKSKDIADDFEDDEQIEI